MPTATCPMPVQESSQVRNAKRKRHTRARERGETECCSQELAALVEHALLDQLSAAAQRR